MKKTLLVPTILLLAAAHAFAQDPGWIGVTIRDGQQDGVEVREIEPDGPAQLAGLQIGDRIVEFNGTPVVGVRQLTRLITETPVGRTVTLTAVRDGEELALSVTPLARPSNFPFRMPDRFPDLSDLEDRVRSGFARIHFDRDVAPLGFEVDRLTPQLREFFGADANRGVLVTSVGPDSPAWDAGLRAGDVVVGVNGEPVRVPGDLPGRMSRDQETVTLRVVRDHEEQDVRVSIPARR